MSNDLVQALAIDSPAAQQVQQHRDMLRRLCERYFRPVIAHPTGELTHHGDCDVYRAIEVYGTAPCTCGLLHDMLPLPEGFKMKLRPEYYEELGRKDDQSKPASEEDKAKWEKFLQEHLHLEPLLVRSEADIFADQLEQQYQWGLIGHTFGPEFCQRQHEKLSRLGTFNPEPKS